MYERDRIPIEEISEARALLLDKSNFSGGDIARRLGVNSSTVWSWFVKRGIPPAKAIQVADILTLWAIELLETAQHLREVGMRYAALFEKRTRGDRDEDRVVRLVASGE